MNKNKIIITENELKQIIAESVKTVLREEFDTSDWTTNEFGEPVPWQYGDYEHYNWRDSEANDIINGDYDDEILGNWDYFYNNLDDDNGWDDTLKDAAYKRRMMLDKDFAMKKGYKRSSNFYRENDINNPEDIRTWEKARMAPENKSNTDLKYEKRRKKEKRALDYLIDKHNGNINDVPYDEVNKEYKKIRNNMYFNKRNPDAEKLHTKGSANRDLMGIDRQRKNIK